MNSHKQGESAYNDAMSIIWEGDTQDEQKITDETTITAKSKKATSQYGNRPNKQSFQAIPKSTSTKRPKEDSPSLKQATQNSIPSSSAGSYAKADKKKNYGVPASATHSTYSRSYASPEITLRDEVKKLKRILLERDDLLSEKEAELLDAEDIIESLQERVRQVEARNRELQMENEIMRNYIEEENEKNEKKKSPANELNKIINSMMNEIRGESGESASLERDRKVEDHIQKENEFTNCIKETNEPISIINSVINNIQRIRGESILPVSISNNIQRVRALPLTLPTLISNNLQRVRDESAPYSNLLSGRFY